MAEEDRLGPGHAGGPGATEDDDARLLHLPERVRRHPLFRQGYALGYGDRARDEHLAGTGQGGPRLPRGDPPEPPPSYGVDAGGLRDRLVPGARVIRELSAVGERECVTEVPCCGRPVTIPVPDGEASPAVCCRCGVIYAAAVAEEEPDGYNDEPLKVAVFVVEHVKAAPARHRAGRWEQARRPRRPGGGK